MSDAPKASVDAAALNPHRPSFGGWVGDQLKAFAWMLLQPLVGPALAMVQRRFHWRAFWAALGVMMVGIAVVVVFLSLDPVAIEAWSQKIPWPLHLHSFIVRTVKWLAVGSRLGARRHEILWPLVLMMFTLAGFTAGRVGKRVGGWESYVALLVTAAVWGVHLAKGWHIILGFGGTDVMSAWDLSTLRPPGEEYFGEMWTRVVGLVAVAGLVLAIFGGSMAFLFFGDDGRRDPRFAIEWFVSRRHLTREGAAPYR